MSNLHKSSCFTFLFYFSPSDCRIKRFKFAITTFGFEAFSRLKVDYKILTLHPIKLNIKINQGSFHVA